MQLPLMFSFSINKSFDVLSKRILRCTRRKIQPELRGVVRIEAPWVLITQESFDSQGRIRCPNSESMLCSIPNGTVEPIKWTQHCCSGAVIEIFTEITKAAGIKNVFLYGVPDDRYGGIVSCPKNNYSDPTKCKWDGLFNELIQKRADVAVTGLTWNHARLTVSDFSEYIGMTPLGIVMHKTERNPPLIAWSFARNMDIRLAVAILVTFVLVYITLVTIENATNLYKIRSFYTVHETLTYLAGLLFQRDLGGRNPYFWSARVPSLLFAFATTIIMTTYTADLTAQGVVKKESSFNGIKDERVIKILLVFYYIDCFPQL